MTSPDDRLDLRWLCVSESRDAESLIVFMHGLDGHWLESWGRKGEPGTFIHRLSGRFPDADVASVEYPSSGRTFASHAAVTVATLSERWAEQISDELIPRYSAIAFVTHCLGGLITLQALRRMHDFGDLIESGTTMPRLFCLLMDAPLSLPESSLPGWLARLVGDMDIKAADLRANLAYFNAPASTLERPAIAVLASSLPSWISLFDPFAVERAEVRCLIPVDHEELSRAPRDGPFEPLTIATQCIRGVFDAPYGLTPLHQGDIDRLRESIVAQQVH